MKIMNNAGLYIMVDFFLYIAYVVCLFFSLSPPILTELHG